MTLALIVLILFLIVWFNQSAKIKGDKYTHRKRTITNVQLQDELDAKNFTLIINDLIALDKEDPLVGEKLIDAIESLFDKYDLPDMRDDTQRINDRAKYLAAIASAREDEEYPIDDSKLPLVDRIWHSPWQPPLLDRPELLYGTPETTSTVHGVEYKYDYRGIASNMFWSIPAKLIGKIHPLLTTRDLDAQGFNYSWDRQESLWQQAEKRAKEQADNKKKYPWLYK